MRKLITTAVAAIGIGTAAVGIAAPANAYYYSYDAWQAVAYSPSTGWTGSAWNYPTAYGAMVNARNSCAYSDCYVVDVSLDCVSTAGVTVCPG